MIDDEPIVDPPEPVEGEEVIEPPEPIEEPPAPVEPELPIAPVRQPLSEIPDDEFLAEAHRRTANMPRPPVQQEPQEDPRMAEVRRLRESYEDDKADKLFLQISTDTAVQESQKQFTERYQLTQQIDARLAQFQNVTPEFKAGLMAQASMLTIPQLRDAIASGNVEREAKAHLYDLTVQGKVPANTPPAPIRNAPANVNNADPGLRGKMTAENKEILKAQEAVFGFPYTDQMIKESGLL